MWNVGGSRGRGLRVCSDVGCCPFTAVHQRPPMSPVICSGLAQVIASAQSTAAEAPAAAAALPKCLKSFSAETARPHVRQEWLISGGILPMCSSGLPCAPWCNTTRCAPLHPTGLARSRPMS